MKSFYEEICKLKEIERRGWMRCKVKGRLESDAEHTFSMIMLAIDIMRHNKMNLDELKVLKMIAYHELCEIDAGDTTPFDNVTAEEKFEKEYACIKRLSAEYDMPEMEKLWLEYKDFKTPEAKFVKHLDKFDAIMQSKIYSDKQDRPDIYEDFYTRSKSDADFFDDFKFQLKHKHFNNC